MSVYKDMYYKTVGSDLDVIEALEDLAAKMKATQRETEDMFIESDEDIDEETEGAEEEPIAN